MDLAGIRDEHLMKILVRSQEKLGFRHRVAFSLIPLERFHDWMSVHEVAWEEANPWSRMMIQMGITKNACDAWNGVLNDNENRPEARPRSLQHYLECAREFARLAGATDDDESIADSLGALRSLRRDEDRLMIQHSLVGFGEGLARRGKRLLDYAGDDEGRRFLIRAAEESVDKTNGNSVITVELLRLIDTTSCREQLFELTKDSNQDARFAAIKAVLAWDDLDASRKLLSTVSGNAPSTRRVIFDGLISRPATLTLLLDAIDKQELQTTDIDPALVPRIVNVADPALKARAQKLFAPPPSADLQKTLAEYSAALKPDIDGKTGRVHFEKHCATCHKVGDIGVDVAPDISDSRTKTAPQILLDILQPNRAVDGNYVAYVVTTNDGRVLTGVISAETSQAITLKQPGGMSIVVPRSEIDELQSTGKSLMPEGLERNIPPQEMAQIVSYIKNWRYLDGRVPASSVPK
jgi:putative heme-binding domain-containing protein